MVEISLLWRHQIHKVRDIAKAASDIPEVVACLGRIPTDRRLEVLEIDYLAIVVGELVDCFCGGYSIRCDAVCFDCTIISKQGVAIQHDGVERSNEAFLQNVLAGWNLGIRVKDGRLAESDVAEAGVVTLSILARSFATIVLFAGIKFVQHDTQFPWYAEIICRVVGRRGGRMSK